MNLLKKMTSLLFRQDDQRLATLMGAGGIGESGENINSTSAMQISTVWACVNLHAGLISSMPVRIMQDKDGIPQPVASHSLSYVLGSSPNYDQTALDFLDWTQTAIELQGDGIAYKRMDSRGEVVALEPLIPANVGRRRLATGVIEYSFTKDGQSYVVPDSEVLHIRGPGGNPLGGLSTLSYGRDAMSLARSAERTQSRMMRNGMRNTPVLTFEKWLQPDQREIAQTGFAERFAGIENTGKPVVLEGGTKIDTLTIKPIDAEMLATRGYMVEDICRFFAVPPPLVGHTSKTTSWPTGLEQQLLMFLTFSLRRRIKRNEMAMEKQLLTPADRAKGLSIRFNFESLLRADSTGRAGFYQTMAQIGAMTINEIRQLEGRAPVAGGEVPRMQVQNVPINQAGQGQPPQA